MNRETYLKLRNSNHFDYLYEYYTENFNEKKYKPLLNQGEFFMYIQQWPGIQNAVHNVTSYYDAKFNILTIPTNPTKYE